MRKKPVQGASAARQREAVNIVRAQRIDIACSHTPEAAARG
jgi:hypothetical protein